MHTAIKLVERRSKARFIIRRDLRYKLVENSKIVASGTGETSDMSSSGVAFTADQPLTAGGFIELSISWPVLLHENCPMRLIVFGRIQRSAHRTCVCTVDKYEFRTQARTVQPDAPVRIDTMLQRWAGGFRRDILKTREVSA